MTKEQLKAFMFAGRAVFTVTSNTTGKRFTYRVREKKIDQARSTAYLYFVSVLTGPDNTAHYQFIGTVFDAHTAAAVYRHSRKSSIGADAPSVKGFVWLLRQVAGPGEEIKGAAVHHEGRCGRCARPLTVPESIESGLGPICAGRGT